MSIEHEGLAIMLGQMVVEGVILPYFTSEAVELAVNQETAKEVVYC